MNTSPYRTAPIAPTPFSPPTGWTRWATGFLIATILFPVVMTVQMLADLKNCDGLSVPRWDEAAVMIAASLGVGLAAIGAYKPLRRRLARIRTKDAVSSGAWSVLGISPALAALTAAAILALHFSAEHWLDTLCIDLRGIFWHGC